MLPLLVLVACCYGGPLVTLTSGAVEGFSDGGVDFFLGIPFGAQQRFMRSSPASSWEGILHATQSGPPCLQLASGGSEDCLFLNVFRPSNVSSVSRTVVWIHGGGYFAGDTAHYDGRQIALQGAIVVGIQYRLGPLGFLPQAANLGSYDQLLALQWVRDNSVAFGGNASRVTIAGESAGGGSVFTLAASPLTAGLFDAAAMLSPGSSQVFKCSTLYSYGNTVMAACNCSTLSCLSTAPVECIMEGFVAASKNNILPFTPCIDGELVTGTLASRLSSMPPIPMMIGTVKDEGPLFSWTIASAAGPMNDSPAIVTPLLRSLQSYSGAPEAAFFSLYNVSEGPWLALTQLQSDYIITCLARRVIRKVATFAYVFDSFLQDNGIG